MASPFLTDVELADLTGLVQPAAQVRWLLRNDVHHYVRADGLVRVPRSAIEKTDARAEQSVQPNFGVLREAR